MSNLFPTRSTIDCQTSFAQYLPGGKLFRAKNDPKRNLYQFLEGICMEAQRANELVNDYNKEFYPDTTNEFLEEWERALGLPDSCLAVEGVSIEDRRRNVLQKLAGFHVQTDQNFVDLATAFGVAATVLSGKDPSISPPITPDKTARFTIVVQFVTTEVFPYTFPIVFGSAAIAVLECIFDKLKPGNCQVIFESI